MSNNIYMDGISNIQIIDGVVRMQLVTVSEVNADNTSAKTINAETIVTTLPGLLRAYDQITAVINKLVEQEVLKKKEPEEPVVTKIEKSKAD